MSDSVDASRMMALVPRIRRARGFRLYAESGTRLLDLWQCGGAAALGHTPPRVLLALKDTASRGLFAPFPGGEAKRLARMLASLVDGRPVVRLYADEAAADRALAAAGYGSLSRSSFADPARVPVGPNDAAALWRPWIGLERIPPVVSPVLPLPLPGCPVALLLAPELEARFPEPAPASPLLLAALRRAFADLSASLSKGERPDRRRLAEALADAAGVSVRGPYIRFAAYSEPRSYFDLFRRFLGRGLLLPPDPAVPAIVPLEMSAGEERALADALKTL